MLDREKTDITAALQRQLDEERASRVKKLTPREEDVFYLLLEGKSMTEVAEILNIKYCTVNTHITGIYKKLEVKSRPNLIIQYRDYRKEK